MKNGTDYYLGLDMGTNSLGWAVTDENYNIKKINGKAMWGIRLFEEASPAADRRTFRSARRRLQRKRNRINLLQEIFKDEISKVDFGFYQRLNDSKYHVEDKNDFQYNTLFNDDEYKDVDFHDEFKSIYHLRKALIEGKKEYDIRLVYLAIHHIIKNRGHFLFEDQTIGNVTVFENVYNDVTSYLFDEFGIDISGYDYKLIEDVLKDKDMSKSKKERKLLEILEIKKSDKRMKAILGLMVGLSKKLSIIYDDEELDELEKSSIAFSDANYDEIRANLEGVLQERCYLIDKLKAVYDWAILTDILKGKEYLSFAKVDLYEKHKYDLDLLKTTVKTYCPSKYDEIFRQDKKGLNNYCAYIGFTTKNKKNVRTENRCDQESLCRYLIKVLDETLKLDKPEIVYLKEELDNFRLLPKQVSKDNGVIPYQIHEAELKLILDNASGYLKFLNDVEESGISNKEKILKIFKFRIPYYVGPLNDAHKSEGANCWIVKRDNTKITPWNFEEVVDLEASAEEFILRMTNKCTYLIGEDVLPKNSLLYSEYMVLNELNNLRINHEKIENDLKIDIYNNLFKKYKKVTRKRLIDYLNANGYKVDVEDISGFDGDFNASLTAYLDFKGILGSDIDNYSTQQMVEQIIRWMLLYGDDKKLLKNKINKEYPNELSEEQLIKICRKKYSGWGRFSEEFLVKIEGMDNETGETDSIIHMLRNTTNNLMMLLSKQFTFLDEIESFNNKFEKPDDLNYDLVKDLYVSPAVKHMLWQTMKVVKEIVKIQGRPPKKIFIEMARAEEKNKARKDSRKKKLVELYKAAKDDQRNWVTELEAKDESDFRRDRLYLYYTQKGKCMYTGKQIDIEDLFNTNVYDVDHIYPQSKVKDDSLNNRVLVKKTSNAKKSDVYPLPNEIQQKQGKFWYMLLDQGLIDRKKYERLVRKSPFSDNELAGFISRQIVETRQSSKAAANLFKKVYGDTEIVYVKANLVSDFRRDYDLLKCREVNDYHHAKDAYLNIVVGNVYNAKFTSNPYVFIKELGDKTYTMNHLFEYDVKRNDKTYWKVGREGTIGLVKKTMSKNNILFTKDTHEGKGGLFNQTIYGKVTCEKGSGYIPLKQGDKKMSDVKKYGGYGNVTGAYFYVVEHTEKGKRIRTIETVYKYLESDINSIDDLTRYSEEILELEEPKIIYKKIKMQSLLKIDGYYYNLTGRTGNQLLISNAVQLCLPKEMNDYIRNISKYLNRCTEAKQSLPINDYDKLNTEKNLQLYDALCDKHSNTIYQHRKNPINELINEGQNKFILLTVEAQVRELNEILKLTKTNNLTADLREIGGSKSVGLMRVSKKLGGNKVSLINQSSTGIFTNEVDLLK